MMVLEDIRARDFFSAEKNQELHREQLERHAMHAEDLLTVTADDARRETQQRSALAASAIAMGSALSRVVACEHADVARDGDGFVTVDEMAHALQRAPADVARFDHNRDGRLDLAEFIDFSADVKVCR